MTDYAPPAGPPPPVVPEGWTSRWNEQYQAWFYVNLHTKKSQWDKPTSPAEDPNAAVPSGPSPSQAAATEKPTAEREFAEQAPVVDLATRPGAAPPSPAYSSEKATPVAGKEPKGSFFNKIVGTFQEKTKSAFPQQQQQQQQQQGYYNSPPPQQQGFYGGPPQPVQQQQQYYSQTPQGGYYGAPAPQQQQYQPAYGQSADKKKGMGAMGGAALGVGAGLLGGALIAGAVSNANEEAYEEGMADAAEDDDDF
ncbi:hypothetical protein PG993_000100 [Apiospora rasikravindrae]|uniref:WW domain-containing protein n=1 Tax=Apiospora rasikravindrae TaxID=990691 RepID=A0ABR1UAA8_9PEZI